MLHPPDEALRMAARYPNIARAIRAAGRWLIGCVAPFLTGLYFGYHEGEDHGRLEMKCAIFGAIDRLAATPNSVEMADGCSKPAPAPETRA